MFKGTKGFTTIEILISMGLFALVAIAASQLHRNVNVSHKDSFMRADMEATTVILNSILAKDILHISPSLNYLTFEGVETDGACDSKELFKLVEKDKRCGLSYDLSSTGNTEIYLLISNGSNSLRHEEIMLPNKIFPTGKFNAKNLSKFLSETTNVALDKYLIKAESTDPNYSILLVGKKSAGTFNFETVHGDNHTRPTAKIVLPFDFSDTSAPWCSGKITPATFNEYVTCLEGSPGSQFIIMKPLRLIRYRVEKSLRYEYEDEDKTNGSPDELMTLYRGSGTIINDNVVFKEYVISNAVSKLKFYREDTSSPIIQFNAVVEKASFVKNLKRRKL